MIDGRQRSAMAVATVMLVAVLVGLGFSENVVAPSKECSITDNKTCAVTVSTTTVKNPLLAKTTAASTVRYEVSGNNTDSGLVPKEVVVIDVTVDPVTGNKTNGTVAGSGNGTVVTAKAIDVTANNGMTVNATTTETIKVSLPTPPLVTANVGVEVVRFVPHKYCYCDILVSIHDHFENIFKTSISRSKNVFRTFVKTLETFCQVVSISKMNALFSIPYRMCINIKIFLND